MGYSKKKINNLKNEDNSKTFEKIKVKSKTPKIINNITKRSKSS